jgi:uncharacterized membrane protein YoaK (UPF0700 family)
VIAIARLLGAILTVRGLPVLRIVLGTKVFFLVAFFVLAVTLGPFSDSDGPTALLTGFAGVAAMAAQNAAQRLHLSNLPPTTLMTGNTIQVTLDAVDLPAGVNGEQRAIVRTRFRLMFGSLAGFTVGCAVAAAVYACIGFWCLWVPVAVGALTAIMRAEN